MGGISGINSASSYSLYGQLASGKRLTSASKGAAQLAISEKQNAQIRGYNTATNNLKSGKDLLNISDAALSGVTDYLQRIRDLSLQASNSALLSDDDLQGIQDEISQMKQGIADIASQTQYNRMNLLDGSRSGGFQIASDGSGNSISIQNDSNSTLRALGIADFDVTGNFDISIRSQGGAQSNRLDYAINFNSYAAYNTTAARSRISDTDYGTSATELKKQQTLQTYSLMMQKRKMQDEARRMQNFWT